MKRFCCSLVLMCIAVSGIFAQTSIPGALKPVESRKYRSENSANGCAAVISGYKCMSGFSLGSPKGGLIADGIKGSATFDLKGAYDKCTFAVGPDVLGEGALRDYSIVTAKADGKIVFDEVIYESDAPRFFTIDVKGANQLVFTVVDGSVGISFGNVKLWKAGQTPSNPNTLYPKLPAGKIQLVRDLPYYFTRPGGHVMPVLGDRFKTSMSEMKTIKVSGKEYDSGLAFPLSQALIGKESGYACFWLGGRYEKVSFIAGPQDSQSSNTRVWLIVKADNKTIYEECIRQNDLSKQFVLDVKGVEKLAFIIEYRDSDFLGGMTLGVVDINAYPAGYAAVPSAGIVNPNKDRISKLPDVCPLMSNIRPFSVRGMSKADQTLFEGESRHYTFSMGGVKYWEGFLLTTGNTLLGDRIDSYAEFDLAGEYDWISFDAGCLSKRSYMDDDNLLIYVDGELVFDHKIYSTWPTQHYKVPVHKCRSLKFARRGTGAQKQTVIGVGDIVLYRGEPVENDIFVHEVPDCPYETDLIDLCGKPYFHYNGRFVSDLTSFNMNDCFLDGSTITRSFKMKDGRELNKGFMLETNIPLGLENVTVMDAAFMLLTGVGASVSSSDVAAYTGVSGGASGTVNMGIFLLLNDQNQKQSAAAAFNTFGQYESCTFTVENMREYMDEFDEVFGNRSAEAVRNPVKLNVIADQVLVGEFWLDNKMAPLTVTVPIFRCRQLMFWLECGDVRSGQYLFHDLKLSKAPCNIAIPEKYTPGNIGNAPAGREGGTASAGQGKTAVREKAAPAERVAAPVVSRQPETKGRKKAGNAGDNDVRVEWEDKYYSSGVSAIDSYLNDVTKASKAVKAYCEGAYEMPESTRTFVRAADGSVYKCFSFVGRSGARLSISDMISTLEQRISEGNSLKSDIGLRQAGVASASLGVTQLKTFQDMGMYGKLIKSATRYMNQCKSDISMSMEQSRAMIEAFEAYRSIALDVDGKKSTDTVLILPTEPSDEIPQVLQQLEYFN